MRIKFIRMLAICVYLGLLVTSCTSDQRVPVNLAESLFENPEPLPSYIEGFRFGNKALCPIVKMGFFENTEDFPMGISLDELVDKVGYSLNGNRVEVTGLSDSRFYLYSCFSVNHLEEGFHIATIHLTRFSGEEVNYTWAFRVDGNLAGLSFDELALMISMPDFP